MVKKSSSFNCDIHDVVEMDTLQVERDLKIKEILNETTKSKEVFRILLFLIFLVLKLTNQIDWSW
jgi:predicted nucleic acid-binding Zn ribbon protein